MARKRHSLVLAGYRWLEYAGNCFDEVTIPWFAGSVLNRCPCFVIGRILPLRDAKPCQMVRPSVGWMTPQICLK